MSKHQLKTSVIYCSLLAFFGGLFGISVLFLLFNAAGFKSPFPGTQLGIFLHLLIIVSLVEEGTKFLFIKKNIGQFPYGFLLGLGFGLGEGWLVYPFWEFGFLPKWRVGPLFLHIITTGFIAYFIKKNRPILGLVIAIIIHTGFNLLAFELWNEI